MDGGPVSRPDHNELLHSLLGPEGPELSCQQSFEQLDRHVELELPATTPTPPYRACARDLEGCSACREDHDSLRAYVDSHPAEKETSSRREPGDASTTGSRSATRHLAARRARHANSAGHSSGVLLEA